MAIIGILFALWIVSKICGSIFRDGMKGFGILLAIVAAPIYIPTYLLFLNKKRYVAYKENEDGTYIVWTKDVFSGQPLKRKCTQDQMAMFKKADGFKDKEIKKLFPLSCQKGNVLELKGK